MKYKKHIVLSVILTSLAMFSFAQTFMVLEKMGTKKRYIYYVGEQIEYKMPNSDSYNRGVLTNILDSAFVVQTDTIMFSSVKSVNINNKRKSNIINAAGPVLITAGVVLLAIDVINRGLIQDGGYTWDAGIGATSTALVATGALIIILKKNKISLNRKGWWRLRKAEIY